jgi:ligand-binding sensor domain-containing protein/signal transduction histidine kinase
VSNYTSLHIRAITVSKRWARIGYVFLLTALSCTARGERLPLRTYTVADGLANNDINKIVRDSRGFLWFCTADGLSRFDGYTFTNYGTDQGLPHGNVTDVLETRGGQYWLATVGGLVRFDPRGMPANRMISAAKATSAGPPMFTVVRPNDEDRRSAAVTALLEDRSSTIWVGTQKGLYRLERSGGGFKLEHVDIGLLNEHQYVSALLEDRHGTLWIAGAGLCRRWPNGSAACYSRQQGLQISERLLSLLEDHLGRLWAGTRGAGFFRLSTDNTHTAPVIERTYSAQDGWPAPWVFQVLESSDHRYWVASNTGLFQFFADRSDQGEYFHAYTTRNGLSYHEITTLCEDRDGNLWLGTNSTGVMKLTREGFTTYDQADGLIGINAIFEDRAGDICFRGYVPSGQRATVFGGITLDPKVGVSSYSPRLGRFGRERFKWFMPDALNKLRTLWGWVGEQVTLQARNGEWWIGTGAGLYRFPAMDVLIGLKTARPLAVYTTRDGLAASQVYRLFEDSRGDIWVSTTDSTTNGLARWEHASGAISDLATVPGLLFREDLARSFAEDSAGNVWVGFNGRLARYRCGRFAVFDSTQGLPPGAIQDIHVDREGRLWLASSRSGLIRIDKPSAEQPSFVTYTTAQGLSSNLTEVITEDLYGRIYVGTGRGLDRLNPATGGVRHFTTADGLVPGAMQAAFRDRLVPASDPRPAPTLAVITGLRVAGEQQLISALGETAVRWRDLTASQNHLQIDFVGLSFAPGEALRYQYKLEETDADWSAATDQRTVNFSHLGPGHYTFLVRAVGSDSVTSAVPATMSFTILPPLWQRWWLVSMAVLVVGLIVYALYRYRLTRLLEVANIRTRIATDLHDDIGSNLTKIAILSEVARKQLGPSDAQSDHPLASIARISRESVTSMSDIVWAINPERDSMLHLTRKMRQHAEELFAPRDIKLNFSAPVAEQNFKLGVNTRRNIFLIFKEAVNNVARHSRCSHVVIDFHADDSWLSLLVADNGAGFDPSIQSDGEGLMSMRRRAQQLGGTFELDSRASEGTTIKLRVCTSPHSGLFQRFKV